MTAVSVVVAAYNADRWLGQCLASLAAQSFPELEVVVVDDGSTDATGTIARQSDAVVLRIEHQGAGAARDAGAARARGDVLVFLDADEVYACDFVERLVDPLSDPAVAGTFPGGLEWHNPHEGLAPGWLWVRNLAGGPPRRGTHHPFPKAVRRSDFERAGGYPHVGFGEDEIFGRRMGPALVVPAARYTYALPTGAAEVFRKSRWIGRGPRFERERPPLWRLLPPWSCWQALRLLARGEARAAFVRMLYDAGRLLGFVEARVRPHVRNVA